MNRKIEMSGQFMARPFNVFKWEIRDFYNCQILRWSFEELEPPQSHFLTILVEKREPIREF